MKTLQPTRILIYSIFAMFIMAFLCVPIFAEEDIPEFVDEQEEMSEVQEETTEPDSEVIDDPQEEEEAEIGRQIIFLGDSYQEGTNAEYGFIDQFIKDYGSEFDQIYHAEEGGYGFGKPNYQFITLLPQLEEAVTEKEKITDFVITGGFNDFRDPSAVSSSMLEVVESIRSMYPNAKLWMAPVGWSKSSDTNKVAAVSASVEAWIAGATENQITIIENISQLFRTNPTLIGGDTTHPTTEGQNELSRCLHEGLMTGVCEIYLYGLHKDEEGVWTYYRQSQVNKEITGLYQEPETNQWIFLNKGVFDPKYVGFVKNPSTKEWWFIRKGTIDRTFTGVAKSIANGEWYHAKNGILDWDFIGFSKSVANGKWYVSYKGKLNWKYTGVAKSIANGEWYHAKNGCLDWNFTGFSKSYLNQKWYFSRNGKLDWNFTGIAKSVQNGLWYFARNGRLDWDFTGVAKSIKDKQWYFIQNGRLNWNFTGVAKSIANGKWYFVRNGKLDWTYTGGAKSIANQLWYAVKDGRLDWDYKGSLLCTDDTIREFQSGAETVKSNKSEIR